MPKRPFPAPPRPAADKPPRPHRRKPLDPPEELFDRTKARVGRPCKLDRQVIADAVQLLEQGNFLTDVAGALGISRETFYDWMAKGQAEPPKSPLHREFSDACSSAQSTAIAVALLQVREGPSKDWRRHAWFLERRAPDRFGKRLAITGAEGAPAAGVTLYQAAAAGVRLPEEDDDG